MSNTSISVRCQCGMAYRWKPELAGKSAPCPACKAQVTFPSTVPVVPVARLSPDDEAVVIPAAGPKRPAPPSLEGRTTLAHAPSTAPLSSGAALSFATPADMRVWSGVQFVVCVMFVCVLIHALFAWRLLHHDRGEGVDIVIPYHLIAVADLAFAGSVKLVLSFTKRIPQALPLQILLFGLTTPLIVLILLVALRRQIRPAHVLNYAILDLFTIEMPMIFCVLVVVTEPFFKG